MDNAIVVGSLKSHCNLDRNADSLFYGEAGFLFDVFLKCDAINQLHYYVVDAILIANVIDINSVRMKESCSGLSFHAELGNEVFIFRKFLL